VSRQEKNTLLRLERGPRQVLQPGFKPIKPHSRNSTYLEVDSEELNLRVRL
jgi:hypothetical protein